MKEVPADFKEGSSFALGVSYSDAWVAPLPDGHRGGGGDDDGSGDGFCVVYKVAWRIYDEYDGMCPPPHGKCWEMRPLAVGPDGETSLVGEATVLEGKAPPDSFYGPL